MNSPDIGEQAISKAAEVGLESQLDQSEDLDVNIRTNPLDLMQGEVDSVSVKGNGLVTQKELRAEKLRIETGDISIDPIKAALGNIELNSPSDARMLVVLKEEDIQRAFNSEYIKDKLTDLEINYQGDTISAQIEQAEFTLPEPGKVKLDANINSVEEILDLRNFEIDEMSLRVRKLDVQAGTITIEADAVIEEFPDA